jgi:hypothetical protein
MRRNNLYVRLFLIIILIIISCSTGSANNTYFAGKKYYVRTDGSDSNTGMSDTAGGAWRTIQHAANNAVAGDMVYIRTGAYPESVTTTNAGSSGAHIVFEGQSGVTLGGFNVTKPYITLRNLTMTGYPSDTATVFAWANGDYLIIESCVFDGSPVGVYQFFNSVSGGDFANNIIIRNSEFRDTKHMAISIEGDSHLIEGNLFTSDYGGDAIRLLSSNSTVRGNTFRNWTSRRISSGSLVVGSTYYFENVGTGGDFSNVGAGPGPYQVGETYAFTCTGTTPINWGTGYVLMSANHPDLFQAFSYYEYTSKNNIIEQNLAIDCADTQLGSIEDQAQNGSVANWVWRNNVFIRVGFVMSIFAPGFEFYNNTFIDSGQNSGHILFFRSSGNKGEAHNSKVKNNIFYRNGRNPDSAAQGWYSIDTELTGTEADFNLVVGIDDGTTKSGFSETHGLNGFNPLFTDAASDDYTLQSNSPCRDSGANLSSIFTNDYAGNTRSVPFDIGAYEYAAACPNLPVRINNTAPGYPTISTAYTAASTSDTIWIQDKTFSGDLSFGNSIIITLIGGYNCGFTSNDSKYSTITGKVTIGGLGRVAFDKVIIQ